MDMTFADIVDKVDALSIDEQETLVDIVNHRLVDHHRKLILEEIEQSREEFRQGLCKEMTVEEFMQEVLS
jgi:hypothetical protein